MSDLDIILRFELRSEFVDANGVKQHPSVEVVADHIQLGDEQVIATHHGSPTFSSARTDVIGIRVAGHTQSSPPRFTQREGQPWTAEEEELLREMSAEGASAGRMAYELGRQPFEIQKRTSQLDLPRPRP